MERMWKSKLPMKIKVFMRLACNDRIQSWEVLKRMNWKGDPNCIVCRKTESADHIFFLCHLAKFVWGCLRDALGWERSLTAYRTFYYSFPPLSVFFM
jgi:hypothetical protein